MSRKKRPLIPEARNALTKFEGEIMKKNGYSVDPTNPDNVKYEIAKEKHISLQPGYNGNLSAKEAGTVGGEIGGTMVKEMIRMAKQNLSNT